MGPLVPPAPQGGPCPHPLICFSGQHPPRNMLGTNDQAIPGIPHLRGSFPSQGTSRWVFPLSVSPLVLPGKIQSHLSLMAQLIWRETREAECPRPSRHSDLTKRAARPPLWDGRSSQTTVAVHDLLRDLAKSHCPGGGGGAGCTHPFHATSQRHPACRPPACWSLLPPLTSPLMNALLKPWVTNHSFSLRTGWALCS